MNARHAPAPPAGLVEVKMRPVSAATQSFVVGQETPASQHGAPISDTVQSAPPIWAFFQDAAPPVGLLETNTSPKASPTTQKVSVGHETLERMHCGGAWTTVHAQLVP